MAQYKIFSHARVPHHHAVNSLLFPQHVLRLHPEKFVLSCAGVCYGVWHATASSTWQVFAEHLAQIGNVSPSLSTSRNTFVSPQQPPRKSTDKPNSRTTPLHPIRKLHPLSFSTSTIARRLHHVVRLCKTHAARCRQTIVETTPRAIALHLKHKPFKLY